VLIFIKKSNIKHAMRLVGVYKVRLKK